MNKIDIEQAYKLAKERYAELHVEVDEVLKKMETVSISIHCWQADDVGGFEKPNSELKGGGIQVTGNYLGKARNIKELRQDLEKLLTLLPGNHRINLHAIYGEFGGKLIDRNQIEPQHFLGWIKWAKDHNVKLDFNCTLFSHPKAEDGFTLSHKNKEIRKFWVEHVKRCRKIAYTIGKELNDTCIHNIWIPDGSKDLPIDRMGYRKLLKESLDEIFTEKYDPKYLKDSVEGKLFGIGSESFVVGSHDFYLGYAVQNHTLLTMDMGHYHPVEDVGEKIPAVLQSLPEIVLHVSRGVHWDSDHIVILNDDLLSVTHNIVRAQAMDKVHLALDYFDASINRVGAYLIGAHATLKAMLIALLEPVTHLKYIEECGNNYKRLANLEELKAAPWGAVWDYYCYTHKIPIGKDVIEEIMKYEQEILSAR
jgi:L-rhamnose isomerase